MLTTPMTPAPFFEDIAFGPQGGAAHWVKTSDGLRIRVAHWPLDGAKGTVLMFPGRTEYIEKYGDAALEFAKGGYATVAVDWRGQGIADRMTEDRAIGHVGKFADYQHDVAALLAHARALHMPEPFYLVGHSMGGCIGLRALSEGLPVKAAAFSAPMWGIQITPAILRPFSWIMGWVAEKIGQGHRMVPTQSRETYVLREEFEVNTLTRDKTMWERLQTQMRAQPDLALGGPSLHWLIASMREMNRIAKLPSPNVPTVTFLGRREAIVDADRITARMADWPNGVLHLLDEAEHEVMLEIPATRRHVYDGMIAHFDANP
ncbi:alpha/beta hydrolase [Yoonia sp. 208BN28-4]|uniref:alpha/beta hydrolase n=1 Tax=Yoonia sp. 208BN28-4 TaxID=3126505 RepID=UPI0030ADCFA0